MFVEMPSPINRLTRDFRIREKQLPSLFLTSKQNSKTPEAIRWIVEKAARIQHLFQTGIWVNEQAVGRQLNRYRFQGGIDETEVCMMEAALRQKISSHCCEIFYREAMKETLFEEIAHGLQFFGEFLAHPQQVGSLFPSSRRLSEKIVGEVATSDENRGPQKYLEVGPGTGCFTYELITKKLRPCDALELVEFDEAFVRILQSKFGHLKNVQIHHADFAAFQSEHKFDHIISGLPLAAFTANFVEKVYEKFFEVLRKGGKISYFQYLGLPEIKRFFLPSPEKKDFDRVLEIKDRYFKKYQGVKQDILLNVTPATVCTIKAS